MPSIFTNYFSNSLGDRVSVLVSSLLNGMSTQMRPFGATRIYTANFN